ncbi:MAG: hypothetical protein ABIJ47_15455 [Candidatus Bathyarchaeota archaeon]
MEPYLTRIQVYMSSVTSHWKLLLTLFSVASLAYTVHIYSQGAAQTIQLDEYMKGGPTTSVTGPFDWIKTLLLAGALGTLILVIYYYAVNWGWLQKILELIRVRAPTVKAVR